LHQLPERLLPVAKDKGSSPGKSGTDAPSLGGSVVSSFLYAVPRREAIYFKSEIIFNFFQPSGSGFLRGERRETKFSFSLIANKNN